MMVPKRGLEPLSRSIRTSSVHVYQFHHLGINSILISIPRNIPTCRDMYITPIFDGYYLNEIAHIYKSHLQIQTKKQVEKQKIPTKKPDLITRSDYLLSA